MNNTNNDLISKVPIQNVDQLGETTLTGIRDVSKKLNSFRGRTAIWWRGRKNEMPPWAARYIESHKQLERAVNTMIAQGQEAEIPEHVTQILAQSKETLRELSTKINYDSFLKAISPEVKAKDERHLLTTKDETAIHALAREWQLNLGLLMNVYQQSQDPEMKKTIQFLAIHYLTKAAPAHLEELNLTEDQLEDLESMFQLGANLDISYLREESSFERLLQPHINRAFPNHPCMMTNPLLTDSTDFADLLPLFFSVLLIPEIQNEFVTTSDTTQTETITSEIEKMTEGWSNQYAAALVDHFQNHPENPFDTYMSMSIMADLTSLLGNDIQTNGNPAKEATFLEKRQKIEDGLELAINKSVDKIKEKYPDMCKTPADEQKLKMFLKLQTVCICRTEVDGVAVLKQITFFSDPTHFAFPAGTETFLQAGRPRELIAHSSHITKDNLNYLVNHSGIRLGGVAGKQKIFDFINLQEYLDWISEARTISYYAVSGRNIEIFQKNDIVNSVLFQRFKAKMSSETCVTATPHVAILGNATTNIFEGMMNEISDIRWEELNANPDTRMILQQSLFRFMEHLSNAENNIHDFTKFGQAIELAQSEISTILAIAAPFKEGDFQEIYQAQLSSIVPAQFRDNIKAGITKSAMNTFIGVNAAVKSMSPKHQCAHGEGAYFESIHVLGAGKKTEEVLGNPDITAVDLYVGEFNHNINIHLDHHHYTPGAVQAEIRQILDQKKDIKHMTVAIDVTIDFIKSPHTKELLEAFSKEIEEGKLNFVFFRSGQKFDMLGVDNYYGSAFWMVNNGGEQWKPFDRLSTSRAHQTDSLSQQWFCLANKYAGDSLDQYRRQIFNNARQIIHNIPADFKAGGTYANQIRVSTVDDGMQPSFIDIKVLSPSLGEISRKMRERLVQRFIDAKAKIHHKSSFGFYHANLNMISAFHDDDQPRNIRINPGLDPEENQLIIDFIREDLPIILQESAEAEATPE